MRTHRHTQNRDDRRRIVRMIHWWLYRDDADHALVEAGAEFTHARKPVREFSARLHFGTKGSETPVDAHLTIAGTGVYANLASSALRRACHAITHGEGRDLSLRMFDGQLWWNLWTREDHCNGTDHRHWHNGRYQPWRCRAGNVPVNPLDLIHGQPKYTYEDLDTAERTLVMPEGEYPVTLTLQRVRHGRSGRKQRDEGLTVDWKAADGIPFRFDHSFGWKGSRYYGSAVKVPEGIEGKDWPTIALVRLEVEATEERVRTGWSVEHEASIR